MRRAATGPESRVALTTDRVWFWVIVGGAFFVRLIYLVEIHSIPLFFHLASDAATYDEWGQSIAAGDWLGKGVFYQAPLYPYFLGFLQLILGHNLWLIRLIQIALGAISCALIFRAGRELFSRQAGIAAGLILACYAPGIFFDGLIEKSILDLFLLSLLLWLLSQVSVGRRWSQWLAMGAVLGLLGLSRENALILAAVLPLWIGLYFSESPILSRLQWIGLFFAGLLLVLLPVGLRNLTVGGEFKLTTSQSGPNFYIGNNPSADGTYESVRYAIGEPHLEGKDAKRLAEKTLGRRLTAGEVSDYWWKKSWNYIGSQPGQWLQLLGKKWLLVWNAREIEDSDDFYIYQQWSWLLRFLAWFNHFGILAPLAVVGIFLTAKQWHRLWVLYAMILSLAGSVAVFFVFGRYRFPLAPLLALFAGAGIVRGVALYQEKNFRPLTIAALILLCTGIVVNWPIIGVRGPGPGGYNNLANAYSKEGKANQAIETAKMAIQLRPDYGVAHFNLGNFYARQGRFDLAQIHFEEALRLYPNYAEAHSNFGQLLAQQGDLEGGIREFRKAIDLNPSLGEPYLNLGVALAKQGRIQEAVGPLQQAARLTPESVEAHYSLGSVYASQERYDEAAKAFKDALRVREDFAAAHQSLAQLLSLQGKKKEAIEHYQEALRLMRKQGAATGQ
ncbi:MAG TPA: tetratricopeptide repeat protein [Candidatus Binatia bacterium]|nr:tetratricopeptide repeat protein [Candidatus Binatia bacterium]